VLLLPETDILDAQKIAERLRMMVSSFSIECEPEELHVTLSLGVACLESGCKSFAELLRRSDEALLEAKRAGRNSIKSWKSRQ
jgi:diguanylate cyclase (GGDEF)-like protein